MNKAKNRKSTRVKGIEDWKGQKMEKCQIQRAKTCVEKVEGRFSRHNIVLVAICSPKGHNRGVQRLERNFGPLQIVFPFLALYAVT